MSVPRKRDGAEALALARLAFGLPAELTHATRLPSYDDQNWLLHSGDVPRYVLKVAAARAECRGGADEASTSEQLQLENAAMRALHAGGVNVPRPLRAKTSEDVVRLPTLPRVRAPRPQPVGVASSETCASGAFQPEPEPASEPTAPPVVEFARLLTFELGEHLAAAEHTPELLHRFGVLVAQSGHALAARLGPRNVSVAAARRLTWDLANAPAARRHLGAVADPGGRALAARYLSRFEACAHARSRLPAQVLHGDLNDYNVLVNPNSFGKQRQREGASARPPAAGGGGGDALEPPTAAAQAAAGLPVSCAGLTVLDFGDIIHSARVYDLAIALAYACQNKPDGRAALQAGCAIVRGYSAYAASQPGARPRRRLTRAEVRVLHACVCARLAQSVLNSAHAIAEEPQNAEYLAINSAPGWALMRQWSELPPAEAEAAYAAAAAEGAGRRRRRFGLGGLSLQEWLLLPAELPASRGALLTGALVGAAAVLVIAVGISAVRAAARSGDGRPYL